MVNFTHCAEFFERDLAVAVAVGEDDGLVDDLLQLCVLQVVADHHLEDVEELPVRDVTVLVHVVDLKRDCKQKTGETQLIRGHISHGAHCDPVSQTLQRLGSYYVVKT